MVDRFTVAEIQVIRESFSLFCLTSQYIESSSQLRCILRSLGIPITHDDSVKYFERAESPIDMERLLEIVWKENNESPDPLDEVKSALVAASNGTHLIEAIDLARILETTGEKLTQQETDAILMHLSPEGEPIPVNVLINFLERQLY
ncbi:hypothetical protein PRIPAC_83440 [Pristionchus pacificus]|nr:hypothetical protein PRIPAC_83440 [Pristionchus pacificus]